MADINNGINDKDRYKITICSPDGTEDVYETNIAFLICDTGNKIQTAQLCRNGFMLDVFQVVKVGQRAILGMIPERHLKMYEAFISSTPENKETDE